MRTESPTAGGDGGGETSAVRLAATVFTDPLCCWSFGFEPALRRLRHAYAGRIAWRLRLAAMIPDWAHYGDPLNSVHRPVQMGPLWVHAGAVTAMPMEAALWATDPPASSVPACLAVAAAGLQSAAAADLMLRRIRLAAMAEGRNVARDDVLDAVAADLAAARPEALDLPRWRADRDGEGARRRLREDVREARYRGIQRFPAVVLAAPGRASVTLVGWRPYGALSAAVEGYAPDLGDPRPAPDEAAYARYWGGDLLPAEAAALADPAPAGAADPFASSAAAPA